MGSHGPTNWGAIVTCRGRTEARRAGALIEPPLEFEDTFSGTPRAVIGRPFRLQGSESLVLEAYDDDAPLDADPMGRAELSILDAVMGREVEVVLRERVPMAGPPTEIGRVLVRFERLE